MKQFTITLSAEEEKALLTDMASVQDWTQNTISNKARQTIDSIIEKETTHNFRKLTVDEKKNIIQGLTLKTAVEKAKELEK